MDSLPTASTPRDMDDAEVGSREGTHQEEEAPEVSQNNLPDFAPDSAPDPTVAPESGGRPLRKKGKTMTLAASGWQPPSNRRRRIACWRRSMAPPSKRNTALL